MQRDFARSFGSLGDVFGFADEFFARERIGEQHRYAVTFALEEIFTNMVKYQAGNPNRIRVELEHEDDLLRIRMTDFDVEPFDVTRAPAPDTSLPLEQRRPGGLGLLLTGRLMDQVDYEYLDRRSRVTLTKRLG